MSAAVSRLVAAIEAKTDRDGRRRGREIELVCPAHDDHEPSLNVTEGKNGAPIIQCRSAGCTYEQVCAAVGLEPRDLFDDHDAREVPPPVKRGKSSAVGNASEPRPIVKHSEQDAARYHRALVEDEQVLARLEELRGWTLPALELTGTGFDGSRIVFPYRDGAGALVGVGRYAPNPATRNGGPKLKADIGSSRELFPPPEGVREGAGWLFLTEGEPDAVAAFSVGLPAVAVPGVNGWRREYAERLRGRRICIAFDCDEPGRAAAQRVAADLAGVAEDVRILDLDPAADDGFDLSDFLAGARTESDREGARRLLERCAEIAPSFYSGSKESALPERNESRPERLPFATLSDALANVPAEPEWVWEGYLAPGAVTLLAGRPKVGKSTLVFGLLDALTCGRAFLDRETRQTGVLLLSEERHGTLAEKQRRFGLDAGVYLLMRAAAQGEEWPGIVAQAVDYCEEHRLGVLVVDVFDKWAGLGGDSENNAGAIVRALEPLALAAASGLSVLLVAHQRKSLGEHGEAVRGSNALTGGVDVVLELERLPTNVMASDGARVLRAVSRYAGTPDELVGELTDGGYEARGETFAVRSDAEREQVREAVEQLGPVTIAKLRDETGIGRETVGRHLDVLTEAGTLARSGKGVRGDPYLFLSGTGNPLLPETNPSALGGFEEAGE